MISGINTREKIIRNVDAREVRYETSRWKILNDLKNHARKVARDIPYETYIYGSVARGDVTKNSDIDIVILNQIPSYMIENYVSYSIRRIVQATPNSVIKAVYEIDEKTSIIFPITPLTWHELEFYDFGGKIPLNSQDRVRGVNKKLLMIEPKPWGHIEWSIVNRVDEVAKILGIHSEVVRERVRILTRRDKMGRTGMYLNVPVPDDRGVEEYIKMMADRDPVVRRRLKR